MTGAARGAAEAATSVGIVMDNHADKNIMAEVRESFQLNNVDPSFCVTGAARGAAEAATTSVPNQLVRNPLARSQHSMTSEERTAKWSEEFDEVTGDPYWVNSATGKSQRTRPAASNVEKLEKREPVWDEVIDEVSGSSYYVNLATGESTWVVPPGYRGRERANKGESSIISISEISGGGSGSSGSSDSSSSSESSNSSSDEDDTRTGY